MKEGVPLVSRVVPGPIEGISIQYNNPEVVRQAVQDWAESLRIAAEQAYRDGNHLPKDWQDRIIR